MSSPQAREAPAEEKACKPKERQRPDVQEKRVAFCAAVTGMAPERFVFLDEMGVHLAMKPARGRAPIGERAVCHVPDSRGGNISVIAAVREDAVLTWQARDGTIDRERFLLFLRERLVRDWVWLLRFRRITTH